MKQYATDMRTALADTLIELEGTNDRILWLDADLMASSGMNRFKAAYPDKEMCIRDRPLPSHYPRL